MPQPYYPRWITPLLQQASQENPIVVLTGARQVGKSTLLLNAEPYRNWRFVSLDDIGTLNQAETAPESLWAGADTIVIDEVQKSPQLLSNVKLAVDRNPRKIRFMLSGSANLLLMKQVGESLAGRAIYFVLDPMTLGEIDRVPPSNLIERIFKGDWPEDEVIPEEPPDPTEYLLRGFMPRLLSLDSPPAWVRWWDGYIATYLERDLRQISQIEALPDFHRLMQLAALRTGQLLNQSEIARDAQISQPTVHRYLNILEATHLFERIPAYLQSHTTRLLKAPKSFWNDPALAVYLCGYYDIQTLSKSRELGAFFETLIYHHLRTLTRLMTPPAHIYYWRTLKGTEVDFVIEHGRSVMALEIKLTRQPRFGDADGLRAFINETPGASGGILLHGGKAIRRLDERIIAVPWTVLTG